MRRIGSAVGAAVVLLALCVGPPVLLLTLQGSPLPDWELLRAGIVDDQTWLKLLGCIAWVLWAQFLVGVLIEASAAFRRVSVSRHVTLGQGLARTLITVIVTTTIAAPSMANAATASAAPFASPGEVPRPVVTASAPVQPYSAPTVAPQSPSQAQLVYVVGSDPELSPSLWAIAERHLGDPLRWHELWQLNKGSAQPDGRTFDDSEVLRLGWRLKMPADATGLPAVPAGGAESTVTVQAGDTLSGIAEQRMGSAAAWPQLYKANAGQAQPGGGTLTDPNVIQPGWHLSIPAPGAAAPSDKPTAPPQGPPARPHRPPVTNAPQPPAAKPSTPPASPAPASPAPVPSASASPTAQAPASQATPSSDDATAAATTPAASRFAGLFAGSGLLAAVVLGALMTHRGRQRRRRRLGAAIAPMPPDLVALDRELTAAAPVVLARMEFVDQALRHLVTALREVAASELPDVIAAGLAEDDLVLLFATPVTVAPPAPWQALDDTRWSVARSAEFVVGDEVLAPFPCLVSVGIDAVGRDWLLDLEHLGTVALTGSATTCLDLLRYLAAELGNNAWSDHLTVTLAGFGEELVDANPTRLAYVEDLELTVAQLRGELAGLREQGWTVPVLHGRQVGGARWMPQVLLAAPAVPASASLAALVEQLGQEQTRSAIAVVIAGDAAPAAAGWTVAIADGAMRLTDAAGQVVLAGLQPHGIGEQVAGDLARAIAVARDGVDVPVGRSRGVGPADEWVDAAGALLPEHTSARPELASVGEDGVAVVSSLLPLPTEVYVASAATTAEDVAALAPAVPADVRAAVEQALDGLDAHLADWHDATCTRPKIRLLGPVSVTASGRPPSKPNICREAVAYLATRAQPVSTEQWVLEFWPRREDYTGTSKYPLNVISQVRHWLGSDPEGRFYLAQIGRDGGETQAYEIKFVLLDVELFRALRARGEVRGADGLPDLLAALELVTGVPLHRVEPGRWEWLPPGEADLYAGMVGDVAHLVATHSLATGDPKQARLAAELALQLDPVNESALCDLAAAYLAEGSEGEHRATVTRITALEELSDRTYDILRQRGWLAS